MTKILLLTLSILPFSASAAEVTLRFPLELWTAASVSGPIGKGDAVTIDYDRMRFKEIVDRQMQAAQGGQYISGMTLSGGCHCYDSRGRNPARNVFSDRCIRSLGLVLRRRPDLLSSQHEHDARYSPR